MTALVLAAIGGGLIGFLLTLFGGGGSVLATPWLIYMVGVADTHIAIGTSAAAVSVNALTGLMTQARAGRVKWPCATIFAATGLSGSLAGAYLGKLLDGRALLMWFAIAMIGVAISMARPKKGAGNPDVRFTPSMMVRLVPIGLVTGFAAGFFGIGGGFLIVPGLMAATGMTLANAAASSLESVALFGAATSASYAWSGLIDWPLVGALVVGGVAGTGLALPLANRLAHHADLARRIFAAMIVLVALYILFIAGA